MNPVTSATSNQADAASTTTKPTGPQDLARADVFLQLLVSQIKNQDPLNPMDSMNFVTQLAQFSQLEATLDMRNNLRTIAETSAEAPAES